MPYRHLSNGLYLMRQPGAKVGIDHYGILDVGNIIGHPQVDEFHPTVIHQTPPKVKMDWLEDTGNWEILGKVHPMHLHQAIQRVRIALRNQDYDFFSNNCEQFARFIAEGESYCTQLQAAGALTVLIALPILFDNRR